MTNARLVEYMTLFPQRCLITNYPNSEEHGPVLDLGVDFEDFTGHAYVTSSGATVVGEAFGWTNPADADAMRAEIARLREELDLANAALHAAPDSIERFLDGLRDAAGSLVPELLAAARVARDGGDRGVAADPAPAADAGELPAGGAGESGDAAGDDRRDDDEPAHDDAV